jgi:hypothetical protein
MSACQPSSPPLTQPKCGVFTHLCPCLQLWPPPVHSLLCVRGGARAGVGSSSPSLTHTHPHTRAHARTRQQSSPRSPESCGAPPAGRRLPPPAHTSARHPERGRPGRWGTGLQCGKCGQWRVIVTVIPPAFQHRHLLLILWAENETISGRARGESPLPAARGQSGRPSPGKHTS